MMASWTITLPNRRLLAVGSRRGLVPVNALDADDIACVLAQGVEVALLNYVHPEPCRPPGAAAGDADPLVLTWALTLLNGQVWAAGSNRSPVPLNGFEAYALAAGVRQEVEAALIHYVGPLDAAGAGSLPLPYLEAAE